MKKVFLIRHGESTSDIEDRFGGDYDDHLTEKGVSQSQELAGKLIDKGIEVIFVSPRFRALETARTVAGKLGVELKIVEDLRERNRYGPLTGMIRSEAAEKYPELIKLLSDTYVSLPAGEDYEPFKERVVKALNSILSTDFNSIGIVTHGGPIRLIFREILKLGELKEVDDCEFFELKADLQEGLTL